MQPRNIFCLSLLILGAMVLVLVAACGQDEKNNHWEEDTLCTPEAFEFTEEELSWPEPPTGLGNQPTDYQINWRRWKAQTERARAIRPKYEAMFWRQPNVWSVGLGFGEDEDGVTIKEVGFLISVTELVPQASLPRSLAGKSLAGFRTTQSTRITVLYDMIMYEMRFTNPLLHRQSTVSKRRLGKNRGFRPSF